MPAATPSLRAEKQAGTKLQRWARWAAHALSLACAGLVVYWATGASSEGFGGGLPVSLAGAAVVRGHERGDSEFDASTVRNWHAVLLVVGLATLGSQALLEPRTVSGFARKKWAVRLHLLYRFSAGLLGAAALAAGYVADDLVKGPSLYTLQSWLELGAVLAYLLHTLVAVTTFVSPGAKARTRRIYLPLHLFLGAFVYTWGVLGAASSVAQTGVWLGCSYHSLLKDADKAPRGGFVNAHHDAEKLYSDLPEGCRVLAWLEVALAALAWATLYAAYDFRNGRTLVPASMVEKMEERLL